MANVTLNAGGGQADRDEIVALIWKYFCPIIVLLGTFGNILSISVYSNQTMRKTVLGPQLVLLAINDLLYLYLSAIPKWLRYVYAIDIQYYGSIVCKLYRWNLNFAITLSPWILIIITLGRVRSVFRPLDTWTQQASNMSGPRIILLVGSVFYVSYSHILYGWERTYKTSRNNTLVLDSACSLNKTTYYYVFYDSVWRPLHFSLAVYIPFIVLFASNIAILFKLSGFGENKNVIKDSKSTTSKSNLQARRGLKLILALNIFFIVTTVPNSILIIGQRSFNTGDGKFAFYVSLAVARMFLYVNSSANFFFYLVTRQFRTELLAMLGWKGRQPEQQNKQRPDVAVSTITS